MADDLGDSWWEIGDEDDQNQEALVGNNTAGKVHGWILSMSLFFILKFFPNFYNYAHAN